ncbi:hypothetical protein ARMA_1865 [Ardenticatena maritima]|uniref:Uncharacterized protein n=1 Tax=Ardenticatena maritima TaxID=872965 RepID=A0A0M9UD03_9CHLR|nr:hypothetical protein ARMA_1865 [Ardenticatena maritima]
MLVDKPYFTQLAQNGERIYASSPTPLGVGLLQQNTQRRVVCEPKCVG